MSFSKYKHFIVKIQIHTIINWKSSFQTKLINQSPVVVLQLPSIPVDKVEVEACTFIIWTVSIGKQVTRLLGGHILSVVCLKGHRAIGLPLEVEKGVGGSVGEDKEPHYYFGREN